MADVDVRLVDVTKRFGDQVAVDGITLDVTDGEFFTLLGPSGCGKTTTLRMIAGLELPNEGRILIAGRDVTRLGASERDVSMVFQSYALFPHMSVLENVAYGLRRSGLAKPEAEKRAQEGLEQVGLKGYSARQPSELSGGQQQRVALARAIVVEPEVLLLDEPLSNLDANLREEMRFEIRRLHDEFKITTVYVTHDQGEAMVTSDRIVVMNKGRVEQVDAPQQLYAQPRSRFVAGFIGRTNFVERDGKTYSLRPHSIGLSAARPASHGVEAEIVDRAYLGEHWDYQVKPLGEAKPLRVSTGPNTVYALGSRVWLEIDPAAMVRVE